MHRIRSRCRNKWLIRTERFAASVCLQLSSKGFTSVLQSQQNMSSHLISLHIDWPMVWLVCPSWVEPALWIQLSLSLRWPRTGVAIRRFFLQSCTLSLRLPQETSWIKVRDAKDLGFEAEFEARKTHDSAIHLATHYAHLQLIAVLSSFTACFKSETILAKKRRSMIAGMLTLLVAGRLWEDRLFITEWLTKAEAKNTIAAFKKFLDTSGKSSQSGRDQTWISSLNMSQLPNISCSLACVCHTQLWQWSWTKHCELHWFWRDFAGQPELTVHWVRRTIFCCSEVQQMPWPAVWSSASSLPCEAKSKESNESYKNKNCFSHVSRITNQIYHENLWSIQVSG